MKKRNAKIIMSIVLIPSLVFVMVKGGEALFTRSTGSTAVKASYEEEDLEVATFAGGCFWCMEPPFEKLDGVEDVISGYTGGEEENPSYNDVSSGQTGHVESVQIVYDPKTISYKEILDVYWRQVDPTDPDGQFVDRGKQYSTAIFFHSEEQKKKRSHQKPRLPSQDGLIKKLSHQSSLPKPFTWQRSIIRIITKRMKSDINTTGTIQEGTSFLKKSGGK